MVIVRWDAPVTSAAMSCLKKAPRLVRLPRPALGTPTDEAAEDDFHDWLFKSANQCFGDGTGFSDSLKYRIRQLYTAQPMEARLNNSCLTYRYCWAAKYICATRRRCALRAGVPSTFVSSWAASCTGGTPRPRPGTNPTAAKPEATA